MTYIIPAIILIHFHSLQLERVAEQNHVPEKLGGLKQFFTCLQLF